MHGKLRLKIFLILEHCLLVVALKVMILDWENLLFFGHLREKVFIQEKAISKLELWVMMN